MGNDKDRPANDRLNKVLFNLTARYPECNDAAKDIRRIVAEWAPNQPANNLALKASLERLTKCVIGTMIEENPREYAFQDPEADFQASSMARIETFQLLERLFTLVSTLCSFRE